MSEEKREQPRIKVVEAPQESLLPALVEPTALGKVFAESGMFPDVQSRAQAVVKILAGRELGFLPLESMTNIYMVNGKLALQAKALASLVKKSPRYDYKVESITDEGCTILFLDNEKKELGRSTFDKKDAARAGIINKTVWKDYPRNMYFARALSNGVRWYMPDVYCGYTPEEVEPETSPAQVVSLTMDKQIQTEDIPVEKHEQLYATKGEGNDEKILK